MSDQITLSSSAPPNVNPHRIQLNQVTAELLQQSPFLGVKRLVHIYDHRVVKIKEKTGKGVKDFLVNMIILNDRPSWSVSMNFMLLVWSVVFAGAAYATMQLKAMNLEFLAPYVKDFYYWIAAGILGVVAALFLLQMVRSFRLVWQFKSNLGNAPIISVLVTNPNISTVKAFINGLSDNIQRVRANNYLPDEHELAVELSEIRRLRDEGLVSDKAYEKAKTKIMGGHASSGGRAAAAA